MSNTVISVENLSKSYQLGVIGTGTFYGDLKRWWAKRRGKPDPNLKIGEVGRGNRDGETIWALNDISFSVQQGEALGIIGRNGAGKSTLLKVLSQVTMPTSGAVRAKGKIASLLEVGTGFHPELTGRENIFLNGAIMGMDRAEVARKYDEIVDFSGVETFIDTPVKRYSSGMYVRLAFAVAAHLDPDILLVDEVLAVGDADFQKKCLGKMDTVTQEGRTILFVSHNMGAIGALCQRVLLLSEGRLQMSGNPEEVISQYLMPDRAVLPVVNLMEHPNRRPGMIPIIAKLEVKNNSNLKTNYFNVGENIVFDVLLNPGDNIFRNPTLSIAVLDNMGKQIVKLATWAQVSSLDVLNTPTTVRCLWKDCRLAPGSYFLNIGLGNGSVVVDFIEQPMVIEIAPISDDYPTGRIPPGLFLPKVEWEVERPS